ncbi:hypothetical protein ACFFS4_11570 [Kutzneria kofuensis]|uniref:Uncharacterized protein n=1 Tax=Kutzneria kofuensis TaxID=103725 RepID=A0A7W9KSK0_9PSEU|nr:hypothetical protein [Kutzneria kofuensis]MBB5897633.1 hypothetical protein [Kutzneria kofuensis]
MGEIVLAAVIVAATVAGVWWVPRGGAPERPGGGWLRHPGTWLAAVIALFFVNQMLFTAYVQQAWHGDTSSIARYMPPGWFDLADLGSLSYALPAWPWTVLHAQSAVELPFGLLAYLLVCRWFGAEAFRRAIHARWLVSASYTVTFCLIEWDLYSPYTVGDLVIRVVSGLVTPLLLPLLSEGAPTPPRLAPFVASVGALGCIVLAVYDTVTLYNLGHTVSWLPLVAVALVVLAAARVWARRPVKHGPTMASVAGALGWFLVLFFVPALPLRYGFNFGTTAVSLLAGAVIVAAAVWRGWDHRLLGRLALAAGAGVVGAAIGYLLAHGYPEARLLAAAVGFLLAGAGVCAALDRVLADRLHNPA